MHQHLTDTMSASEILDHPVRARINAWFFRAMDGYAIAEHMSAAAAGAPPGRSRALRESTSTR
jgi:hypothetical protein